MATASIRSLRNGLGPIVGASRDDLEIGDVVTVESVNNGTAYAWSLAYRPEGSLASFLPLGGEVTKGPLTFTVDKEGPYLIGLQYTTMQVLVASAVSAGQQLVINGITLEAVSGVAGVNQFTIQNNTVLDAAAIMAAINNPLNGWSGTITAHNAAGSAQVVLTPVVDGTPITVTSSSAQMVPSPVTTEQFVRLRSLTEFGSLHLVSAGEQYGGSNPPVPVDINPVGWTNEQNGNLLSLLALIETVSTSGNIVYVDPISGNYNTIQAAIDYCATQTPSPTSQWIVAVRPGVYTEELTFAPFVHVIGWPGAQQAGMMLSPTSVDCVKVRQTGAMAAHAIEFNAANELVHLAGLFFERPGAGAAGVVEEGASNVGSVYVTRCRFTTAGTGACYTSVGAETTLEDCVLASDGGRTLIVGNASAVQTRIYAIRTTIKGDSGIQLKHNTWCLLRDSWVEPAAMGSNAIDLECSNVANQGMRLLASYSRIFGTVTANSSTVGCADLVELIAEWCSFSEPGSITIDGSNCPAGAFVQLGASVHGPVVGTNGAVYKATVPADTIFYDNALVSHSRLIGPTEIAGDLLAENVQDALDEIYTYAIQVRTLDDAYDAGLVGGGLGRDIYADSGAVRILDGNPPSPSTPITDTDGQLKVVSKVEIGSVDKAEIKLDPNPWGMGAEITLGEELWIGNAPYGTPTFIWANSTATATYHNYDLILSAHPTEGGDQVGSIIIRGGAGLNSGKGTDPGGGDVHLVGGDALGENIPAGPSAPGGGNVYIAPGGVRFPATAGGVGTILLGRPEDATRAVLNAPLAYTVPVAAGSATFGTDLGAFTIDLNAGDVIATAIGKLSNTQYVIASENPPGFIQIESATKGPLAQVFYVGGDAATNTDLGNFQGALQTNGTWPSSMEVVVSAANEISFGPNALTGPLVYNADTGKLTVPGVIDPTGMIYTESTLANITLAANGWTGAGVGGLYVSDGTDGQDNNHLYYVFEDGTPIKLSGGGGGGGMTRFFIEDSAGNTSTILDNDTIIFDNSTGETTVAVSGDNVSIGLANTGVTAGTYISPVIAVDSTGRITSALNAAGLQGAYDYGNTLTTAGPTDITFTLSAAGGGFVINGDGNVMIGVVSRVGTFSANSIATATLSSQDEVDINADNGTTITRNGGLDTEILTLTQSGGQTFGIFAGTADPSGSVTADAGSLFVRDTGAGAELYQNTSTGSGTTWSQVGAGGGGLPAPTAEGEILYAPTPAAFVQATPKVNASGFILVNASGHMVV